ncbi:MAG TPA: xanthine dehydrogenase family protein molybdopterin-binding subunit [Candidatus Dormibacteraeota bacterium]|nr:xanthine dehydrogenase family protein molybdopterin-binding subunit [Candidatus Dormibacteraeota bacterium]
MAVSFALGGVVKRREDPRLVTGAGQYTDDVQPAGCLHAVFVRSPHAHARITGVDSSAARAMSGVVGIFQAADLTFESETARPRLCSEEVKFVGDAIAVAVATTRGEAVDAAAAVIVDYEPLPVLVDSTAGLQPGAPLVHPDNGSNLAFEFELGEEGALDGADVVVRSRFVNQRLAAVPIEANAVVAEPDGEGGIRMWASTQVPFGVRTQVADALGLPESKVHVSTGDVGGAFGAKLLPYPEQSVIAALAKKLDRPVRWFEYRTENMVAMTHGRGHVQEVALGAMADGKLVGLEADVIGDAGAYSGLAPVLMMYTALLSTTVYDIPHLRYRARSVFTNTAVMSAYRGAGRPEAIAMMERAMDMLAAELRMDPAELRRRNLIHGEFPYTTTAGSTYDSGDYVRALDIALDAAGYEELRREQRARRERGDRLQLGVGLCVFVEMTAVGQTSEVAVARVEADGSVSVAAGTTSSGQGHETAYAQLSARLLDVPMSAVSVKSADTEAVGSGGGTFGSRSLQLGGSAVRSVCLVLIDQAKAEAARRLEANPDDVVRFDGGRFGVTGVPGTALSWAELASQATLSAEREFEQDGQTFPFGCHIAVAEVDVETGEARLGRHIAVDDCGTVLNRMLVEGQIHGGVAQGVAQALYEEFVYDADGNPLTTSLVDYAIPTIGEIPNIETVSMETPTPLNPLGAKGVGESGTIGSTPAVQNAVIDAVSHLGVRHIDMPLHPMRVWEAIRAAKQK